MANKKTLRIEGYTIRSLKWTPMFKGGIISIYKDLALYNEIDVQFCISERYKECVIEKECAICRPRCEWDKLDMVGKKSWQNLTKADRKKIDKILNCSFKECRPIQIVVTEKG